MREIVIDYNLEDKTLTLESTDRIYASKIHELVKKYPEEVKVIHDYPFTEEADSGSILVSLPVKWFKLPKPPKKMNLTDEQIQSRKDRMSKLGSMRRKNQEQK